MREIRIRAWDKLDEHMHYDGFDINCHGQITRTFGIYTPPIYLELMMWTGLTDRHGKEIWEGDILRTPQDEVGKVVYSLGSFWMQYIPPYDWDPMVPATLLDDKNFEIIGNIYENPELLGEKE